MIEVLAIIVLVIAAIWLLGAVLSVIGLVLTILSWLLAGYLAGRLLRGRGYGPLGDVLLGLAGGLVGGLLLRLLSLGGIGSIPLIGNILVGVIGAVILVFVVRLVAKEDFAR